MLLDLAQSKLGWPSRGQVLNPSGHGAAIYARLADKKLGNTLRLRSDARDLECGVLSANPASAATEAPIAIVCEFQRRVSPETLREAHRLAWNFSRSPLLLTLEPHLLRAWSCCEPPPKAETLYSYSEAEIQEVEVDLQALSLSQQAAQALHWVELVTGSFFRKHEDRFRRDGRADQLLLSYLKALRQRLKRRRLPDDICHDLLARIIFIQFLSQRKDSEGKAALSEDYLSQLHDGGCLSARYTRFEDLLRNRSDTYSLFRRLNEVFNGDLFPGKGATPEQREDDWLKEMQYVKQSHLNCLADFISGKLDLGSGQGYLWPQYSFDAIPLEFISSIYEEFVSEHGGGAGTHYTPAHLVDFLLDVVLPWDDDRWDIKVLDPACGSGIFLVKVFQRLIHRWKNAHPGRVIRAAELRGMMENNLFGVDIDPHAVRVASFSLYLAMCDEIDPRRYWKEIRFPRLREHRLVQADFFREDVEGIRTVEDRSSYDLVVGNAPWGRKTETELSKTWARTTDLPNKWKIPYQSIGPLFLPKAIRLCKPDAQVSMLQPAGALLFNTSGNARDFRESLFSKFKVEEVVNLSALRFELFPKAVAPACIITLRGAALDGEPLSYVCPKPIKGGEVGYRILIEPLDMQTVYPEEATGDPFVWTALAWGGRRDLSFLRELSHYPTLDKLERDRVIKKRQGPFRGRVQRPEKQIVGRRILYTNDFPEGTFLVLNAKRLPIATDEDARVHYKDSTDFDAFASPQLIIKQSWQVGIGRFRAATVRPDKSGGIICSRLFASVHGPREWLEAACLSLNSKIAVYVLLLTSGRFASYRPEPNVDDFAQIPIPEPSTGILQGLTSLDDLDERVHQVFPFKESQWVLVDDLINYTLPDFKGDASSPGRQRTIRLSEGLLLENQEPELREYCRYFLKVLGAGFGRDKHVCATVFQEGAGQPLPVRLLAIHLDWPGREEFRVETIDSSDLLVRLWSLDSKLRSESEGSKGGIFYQRVARVYDAWHSTVPTIYLIKPDQVRHWTRSTALRDADEVASDILLWKRNSQEPSSV